MKLSYLYFKSYGNVQDVEVNLDARYAFSFDGEVLHCRRGQELRRGFFSVGGVRDVPVECISAVIGENGSGKTSVARFAAELLSGSVQTRDYIVVLCLQDRYHVLYNLRTERKGLFAELDELMPECSRIDASNRSRAEREAGRRLVESIEMVYLSPHFTAKPIFESFCERVHDYSTSGLIARVGSSSSGLRQVGRYAAQEQLRALRFIDACRETPSAPSEPWKLLRRTGVRIVWQRNTLTMRQQFDLVDRENRDDYLRRVRGIIRELPRCEQLKDDHKFACINTFVYFAIAYLREQMLEGNERDVRSRRESSAFEGLVELCEWMLGQRPGGELVQRKIFSWIREWMGTTEANEGRARGLEQLLAAMDCLGKLCGYEKRPRTLNVPISQDDEGILAQKVLAAAEGYAACVRDIEFLGFEFSPRLSSGEMAFLSMWGRLYACFREQETKRRRSPYDVLVFMDETETALHPEWQRKLVWYTIWFFEHFARHARAHIVFSSHSPILLTDIPRGNVSFLFARGAEGKRQREAVKEIDGTFAANLYDLYQLSFFLKEGPIGEFARTKIADLRKHPDERIVRLVGDGLLRSLLARVRK